VKIERFREVCSAIAPDVYDTLNVFQVSRQYQTEGSGGLESTRRQIEYWKTRLQDQ
jgi:argininosuccinate lyase